MCIEKCEACECKSPSTMVFRYDSSVYKDRNKEFHNGRFCKGCYRTLTENFCVQSKKGRIRIIRKVVV